MSKELKQITAAFLAILIIILLLNQLSKPRDMEGEPDTIELHLDKEYYNQFRGQNKSIIVYNWGEYISDGSDGTVNINEEFTKATGIKVNYITFSTNEELYAKLRSGNAGYDVIIPSDYMIGRMIEEDMLQPLNFEMLPNFSNIEERFQNPDYDLGSTHSIPYTWGITGIIYNKARIAEGDEVDSWNILWDDRYKNDILMFSNSRDAFGIAESKLGISLNTENPQELKAALEELKKQKPLVQAYVMDEIFDKMLGGEATFAPYYAGDAITMMEDNPDLDFAIPKEGVNIFVDAMAIPKDAPNAEAAHLYLNFLMEPEIAAANAEYIGYATPNETAIGLLDEEVANNPIAYPPEEALENAEFFLPQSREISMLMDQYWTELLSADDAYNQMLVPVLLIIAVLVSIGINLLRMRKKRLKHHF